MALRLPPVSITQEISMCYSLTVYLTYRAQGYKPAQAMWYAINAFNLYN